MRDYIYKAELLEAKELFEEIMVNTKKISKADTDHKLLISKKLLGGLLETKILLNKFIKEEDINAEESVSLLSIPMIF